MILLGSDELERSSMHNGQKCEGEKTLEYEKTSQDAPRLSPNHSYLIP